MKPSERWSGIGKQAFALRALLPQAVIHLRRGRLTMTAVIRPTAASCQYTVRVRYDYGGVPVVRVIAPELRLHADAKALPHTYPDDTLCLHLGGQWRPTMLIAQTTVPWISEWLFYYEIWLTTGKWLGGGHQAAD